MEGESGYGRVWFIYSEPKVAYGADHGIYELRVKKSHCK